MRVWKGCWHFWRPRHKYINGKHCNQCCSTFEIDWDL